jgi:hypothetical protein
MNSVIHPLVPPYESNCWSGSAGTLACAGFAVVVEAVAVCAFYKTAQPRVAVPHTPATQPASEKPFLLTYSTSLQFHRFNSQEFFRREVP